MPRKLSKKYNDSCIKIFAMLSLLSNGTAEFSDIIKLFSDDNGEISQKANVTLNKYLNTLKIFGIEITKTKNQYRLMKMPFSINLSEQDLLAVALIKSSLGIIPNSKNKTTLIKLIEEIERRYDYSTMQLDTIITKYRNYDLSFYFKKFEKRVEECERYCQENKRLELYYTSSEDDNNYIAFCTPLEIKYLDKEICLSVHVPLVGQIMDIPISRIKNIIQLDTPSSKTKICTNVIFKLKGSLAKRYKLRDWETSMGYSEDGWLTIINSGEDFNSISTRLLKYDSDCIVVSPKYLREKIIKTIDKTLKNYL